MQLRRYISIDPALPRLPSWVRALPPPGIIYHSSFHGQTHTHNHTVHTHHSVRVNRVTLQEAQSYDTQLLDVFPPGVRQIFTMRYSLSLLVASFVFIRNERMLLCVWLFNRQLKLDNRQILPDSQTFFQAASFFLFSLCINVKYHRALDGHIWLQVEIGTLLAATNRLTNQSGDKSTF